MRASSRSIIGLGSLFLGFGSSLLACSDAGEGSGGSTGTTTGTTTSSTTGATTSSATTSTTTTSATTSASSTSSGMPVTCLPAAATSSYFSIQTNDLCAVAIYSASGLDLSMGSSPTWGRQDGLLTGAFDSGAGKVTVQRWSLSGTSLSKTESSVTLADVSPSDFYSGQLLDLLADQSALAWTGPFMAVPPKGAIELVSDTTSKASHTAIDVFSLGKIGPDANGVARLLYTGTTALDAATNTSVNGLYAADFKATGAVDGTPSLVAGWGENSGPVAVDSAGNAFAIGVTTSTGKQELRGFEASKIKPLSAAVSGDVLLDTAGSGTALAAIAPTGSKPGLLVFQPDSTSFTYEDVVLVSYTVAAGKITAVAPVTLLKLATANTGFTLTVDNTDRIWVGAQAPNMSSTFIVLARP